MRSRKKRKDDSCRILKVDNRSLRFYVCRSLVRVFEEAGLYMYLNFIYVLFFCVCEFLESVLWFRFLVYL